MFSSSVDYLGKWFEARVALGISDTIFIGKVNLSEQEVRWQHYRHRDCDGAGALSKALEKNGYPTQQLPFSSKSRPAIRDIFKAAVDLFGTQRPVFSQWKSEAKWIDQAHCYPAWRVLSEDESATVRKQAALLGVSLNTYIFWCLNNAVANSLLREFTSFTWFYPVNMRGSFTKNDRYSNHSSGVYFNSRGNIGIDEFSSVIKVQLKQHKQWGLLVQGHIGTLLGLGMVKRLYQRASEKGRYVGSYSTLGKWPRNSEPQASVDNEAWLLCAPGSPSYPVSTGVIEWDDKITFCVKLQSNVLEGDANEKCDDAQAVLLSCWLDTLLSQTA